MDYVPRIVDQELAELMSGLPAIVLEGPRGVGKTATGARRATASFNLDHDAVLQPLALDLSLLDASEGTIFIDEWQRLPQVWDYVRRKVDAGAEPGRFLLAGSATPTDAPAHSGAGRITQVRMRPLSLAERGLCDPQVSLRELLCGTRPKLAELTKQECPVDLRQYVEEITSSGFPGIRPLTDRLRRSQLDSYLVNLIRHDFPEQGVAVRRPESLQEWLRAYAAATSTTAAYNAILDAATPGQGDKPSKNTTLVYRDILTQLWLLDPVPGWVPTRSRLARLTTPHKHQLVDPALAARLLEVDSESLLAGKISAKHGLFQFEEGTLLGNLFESLVTQSMRVYAQAAEARVNHLRTRNGEHEINLMVTGLGGKIVAMEVKLTDFPSDDDAKHLRWLQNQLGDELVDAVIVTAGRVAYRREHDNIAVIPAAWLGP